jgi:TIR domain/Pentapeptide repeats (8 copies)
MDRNEAIKLLSGGTKGIAEWNEWRAAREKIPDFSKADLTGANLSGANLNKADLTGANLRGANLREAKLNSANLSKADLTGVDLSFSLLFGTILNGANLSISILVAANFNAASVSGANLSRSILTGTILYGADLSGADLSGAIFGNTIIANVDLSDASGLDSVIHGGPSAIGIDTIYRSNGKIPEVFLRGCGLPDALISYLPSMVSSMSPIEFYSSFISYSAKDTPFAERLYADLQSKGVRCWYAPEDLKIGEKIRVGIDQSIRVHEKLLLILSRYSVKSEWVEKEVEAAMERERRENRIVLFPIRLDDAVMKIENGWPADVRRSRNIGDFRGWKTHDSYQKSFDRLMRDLKAEESANPAARSIPASRRKKPH